MMIELHKLKTHSIIVVEGQSDLPALSSLINKAGRGWNNMKEIPKHVIKSRQESARLYSMEHPPREKVVKICCVAGCYRECESFSFCNRHYQEWLQYGCIKETPNIKTLDGEVWRDIASYEGIYKVSNFGRVLSLPRESERIHNGRITTIRVKAKIMKPDVDYKGYCRVGLSKDRKCVSKLVHRLVAEAFIPNPNKYPQVNHIDCNPSNNKADNLEWCNQSIQEIHKINTTGRGNRSLVYQPVRVRITETGEEFRSMGEAVRKTGIPMHILFTRLNNGKPDNNGQHWEYVVN